MVLVCADLNFKVSVTYQVKNNIYVVNVQDEPYLYLPYVAPNQNYGGLDEELLNAMLLVNDKVVIDEAIHWNFLAISEEVEVKLGHENLKSFEVKNLECKSFITNELLDIIATQFTSETDELTSMVFSNFKESCGPFDESLLDRFSKSSNKL